MVAWWAELKASELVSKKGVKRVLLKAAMKAADVAVAMVDAMVFSTIV